MRKVIVDFVAHRSVVVALNDDEDSDKAIEMAQDYVERNNAMSPMWDYEDFDDTDDNAEAINEDDILTCNTCHRQFVDKGTGICPDCKLSPEETLMNAIFGTKKK